MKKYAIFFVKNGDGFKAKFITFIKNTEKFIPQSFNNGFFILCEADDPNDENDVNKATWFCPLWKSNSNIEVIQENSKKNLNFKKIEISFEEKRTKLLELTTNYGSGFIPVTEFILEVMNIPWNDFEESLIIQTLGKTV